jgi:hypothetical protein
MAIASASLLVEASSTVFPSALITQMVVFSIETSSAAYTVIASSPLGTSHPIMG